jgi:hypothetical protein
VKPPSGNAYWVAEAMGPPEKGLDGSVEEGDVGRLSKDGFEVAEQTGSEMRTVGIVGTVDDEVAEARVDVTEAEVEVEVERGETGERCDDTGNGGVGVELDSAAVAAAVKEEGCESDDVVVAVLSEEDEESEEEKRKKK